MKAKKGGNVDVNKLQRLFADDIAMRTLLSDCNREEVLSFFKDSPTLVGGAKRGREERREELEDDEELLAAMEEMPVAKRQRNELEFPDKCSIVQRAIAIFASATIELMYKGATSAAACYMFPEQMSALSNIMSGFLSVIGQNVGGQGTIAAIGAIGGILYTYQRDGKVNELIGKIFALAKKPFPGNSINSILKRAIILCENDLVPIGRNVTVDSIKQRFWNKLGDIGLGPVAESRRQKRQSELARLKKEYQQMGIPIPPPMGMPSKKQMMTSNKFEEILREVPRIQSLLQSDLSDREKLENARNMIEVVRKEVTNARNRKAMLDKDIELLESDEMVPENPALMQDLEEKKVGSEVNANQISKLLEKESELLSDIRKLENLPRRLERTMSVRAYDMPSVPEEMSLNIEEPEQVVVVERSKKSKKRKEGEGGAKRRTHRKKHHEKKSKKNHGGKHYKKSVKRHHKKTHKKH